MKARRPGLNTLAPRRFALAVSVVALGASFVAGTASAAKAKSTASKTPPPLVAATTSSECTSAATRAVFGAFGDTALYAAVIGGNMEPAGQSSWLLWPGASFVAENEPYYLSSRSDAYSLRIPAGSFANAPWICVGESFPTARFVVKNTGTATGTLSVDVQYASADFGEVVP